MTPPASLAAGQTLANYRIVRFIGKGGMGTVYEAFHPILKRRFAIKTLLASAAQIPDARARFLREAEAVGRIGHPNVVQVTDVGVDGDTPYLVMEYLEGQTLADLLAERGRLDIDLALDLLLPVLAGVAAGHAMGVIHRDLKPENIFLARGARGEITPKVLDFGVSKLLDDAPSALLTGAQAVLGTAAYMSPEQARGAREVDHLSDQYALGLLFYEALAGMRAHPGRSSLEILHNIANLPVVRLRHLRPDCPQGLEDIVMRMLSPTPEYRFPSLLSAGATLLALASVKTRQTLAEAFVEEAESVRPPAAPGSRSRRSDATTMPATSPPRSRGRVLLGAVLALLISGGTFWAWRRSTLSPPGLSSAPPAQPHKAQSSAPEPPASATLGPDARPPVAEAREPSRSSEPEATPPRRSGHPLPPRPRQTSKTERKVFNRPDTTSGQPRRGANDALILE